MAVDDSIIEFVLVDGDYNFDGLCGFSLVPFVLSYTSILFSEMTQRTSLPLLLDLCLPASAHIQDT